MADLNLVIIYNIIYIIYNIHVVWVVWVLYYNWRAMKTWIRGFAGMPHVPLLRKHGSAFVEGYGNC